MCLRKEVLNKTFYKCFLFVPNISFGKFEPFLHHFRMRQRRVITSLKLNLWNHGIGLNIQKEQAEKCLLTKNQPFGSNWWGDKSNVILQWLHINTLLLKLAGNVYVKIQANLRRIRMKSSEQTGAYIYPSICTIKLLFDKGTFFILFFLTLMNWSHTSFLYCLLSSLRG